MDQLSTSIVSSCCRMRDVMSKGITCKSCDWSRENHVTLFAAVVEALEKSREPQLAREAIYIMWPCEEVKCF